MQPPIKHFPKLIVFDLDLTLWDCGAATWVELTSPPFRKHKHFIVDSVGNEITLFRDVPQIIKEIAHRCELAVASRTESPPRAKLLLKALQLDTIFKYQEIYPGCKVKHFKKLVEKSGIDYKDILFFDDEMRNIRDVSKLGVTCVLADGGLTRDIFEEGLKLFAKNRSK